MAKALSDDAEVNRIFGDVVTILTGNGYSDADAVARTHEYYARFTDPAFCESIQAPLQDADFFNHEGAPNLALRVHYYLTLKGDPNPVAYIDWRKAHFANRRTWP